MAVYIQPHASIKDAPSFSLLLAAFKGQPGFLSLPLPSMITEDAARHSTKLSTHQEHIFYNRTRPHTD
ncbi:MAG: hypothetical protein LC731_02645, partial [Acidobacteria bacterium]|nr:hypothetical protein [Acidobacteriota bacterium]